MGKGGGDGGGEKKNEGERKSGSEGRVSLELQNGGVPAAFSEDRVKEPSWESPPPDTHRSHARGRGRRVPTVPFLTNKQAYDVHLLIVRRVTLNALAYSPRCSAIAAIPLHSKYLCISLILRVHTHTHTHSGRQHPLGCCSSVGDKIDTGGYMGTYMGQRYEAAQTSSSRPKSRLHRRSPRASSTEGQAAPGAENGPRPSNPPPITFNPNPSPSPAPTRNAALLR